MSLKPAAIPALVSSLLLGLLTSCALGLPDPVVGGKPQLVEDVYLPDPPGWRAEPWVSGLEVPWSLVFLPDGRALVSERPGRIRLIRDGALQAEPYAQLPVVSGSQGSFTGSLLEAIEGGEGGVLGLAVHPDFPAEPYIYAYQTVVRESGVENQVIRLSDAGAHGVFDRVIFHGIPGYVFHNGGRIAFGPDGLLYVAAGESLDPDLAQDAKSFGGKILRITDEGAIPPDNPCIEKQSCSSRSPIYAFGLRNPQGLAWDPETGTLFASDHGPTAEFGLGSLDEVNLVRPGSNHGWPLVVGAPGIAKYNDPLAAWPDVTTPPSGMTFHQGDLFVATLGSEALLRIALDRSDGGFAVTRIERWFAEDEDNGRLGRLRDIVEGPDGRLYLLTNNRDGRGTPRPGDDRIYRLVPQ